MYKLFLCLRYLRKRRIAFFAIAAVWLCTAMVLIVISVMGGFLDMVKARSRGLLGDLIMENGALQGFPFYQEFIDQIKKEMPDRIEEATPVIVNYGLLRFPSSNITKPAGSMTSGRASSWSAITPVRTASRRRKSRPSGSTHRVRSCSRRSFRRPTSGG